MAPTCYARGNLNAPIFVIGECPGKEEIEHNIKGKDMNDEVKIYPMPIPFCGKAGRLAHALLSWVTLREGEFILDNIINEQLTKENGYARVGDEKELKAAVPSLLKRIVKIDPKLIITFGKGPIWALCYRDKLPHYDLRIGHVAGKIHELEIPDVTEYLNIKCPVVVPKKYKVLPLYHPSAVLRDKNKEKGYKDQISKIMKDNSEMIGDIVGRWLFF